MRAATFGAFERGFGDERRHGDKVARRNVERHLQQRLESLHGLFEAALHPDDPNVIPHEILYQRPNVRVDRMGGSIQSARLQ